MKFLVVLACLTAVVFCAPKPQLHKSDIRVLPALRHEEIHDEYGQYALRYITAEDTVVSEVGRLIPSIEGDYVMAIEGQYEYIGDNGKLYVTKYRGGPEGFQILGSHIPQPAVVAV